MTTEINTATLRQIRVDMNEALKAVATKYGLKFLEATNAKYGAGGDFKFNVEGLIEGGTDKIAQHYEQLRRLMPTLPPLGAAVSIGGTEYTVTGSRGYATVILTRVRDDKTYTAKAESVARNYAAQVPSAVRS